MLVERIITMAFPGKYAALAINLSSGLFTALAAMIMAKCIFIGAVWVLKPLSGKHSRYHAFLAGGAAFCGALIFGFSDSVWFSAVEAEVYALSLLLTALSVWIMLKWAMADSLQKGWKYLILLAYIFGLSLGVHQLNLLTVPVLALIWCARRGIAPWWKILLVFLLSLIVTGAILTGIMPSSIALAARFELFAVNNLGLPALYGVAAYIIALGSSLILALFVTSRSSNRGLLALSIFFPIFLSGLFIFSEHFLAGAAVSAIVSILMVRGSYFKPHRLNLAIWLLTMLLVGYSAYALIPIRGNVAAPSNSALPGDPFSFAAYQAREQYGASPLLYGHTPLSVPLILEEWNPDSTPLYQQYSLQSVHPVYKRITAGMRLPDFTDARKLTPEDSAANKQVTENLSPADYGRKYVICGYKSEHILTPELDMWFPRITSRSSDIFPSYADWAGASPETMDSVKISEIITSDGIPGPRKKADGSPIEKFSFRPTYLQHLKFFISYQTAYMYLRYLMWNFSGRQNDYPSQGEVEHGNFITGFPSIDNAMLGAEELLPDSAGKKNPGRNRYFLIPFLLGLTGAVWLICVNRRGRLACGIIFALFVMTGIAIVVYLNQSPGEARERDYTFLGSYMAFAAWISAGEMAIALWISRIVMKFRCFRTRGTLIPILIGFLPSIALAAYVAIENVDDHDRSGRRVASAMARNILESLDKNAVIFVDGDNYTFPLWYAQEVEGIRRDVKVVNISYLHSPNYAAAIRHAWEEAPALKSAFSDGDIIYNALLRTQLRVDNDSIPMADDALKRMLSHPAPVINVSDIHFDIEGDTITFPLQRLLIHPGGHTIDFGRLMMLDIIASNAGGSNPRPIYWINSLPLKRNLGLEDRTRQHIFARRLAADFKSNEEKRKVLNTELMQIRDFIPLNDSQDVYMDPTPAGIVTRLRADLIATGLRLADAEMMEEAAEVCRHIDRIVGNDSRTFINVMTSDTLFHTARNQSRLLRKAGEKTSSGLLIYKADSILKADSIYKLEWQRYVNALPARLRKHCSMIKSR